MRNQGVARIIVNEDASDCKIGEPLGMESGADEPDFNNQGATGE